MCKVLNKHVSGVPTNAVYIGRGSNWGNPLVIGRDGVRDTVIAKHERWLPLCDKIVTRTIRQLQQQVTMAPGRGAGTNQIVALQFIERPQLIMLVGQATRCCPV